MLRVLLTAKVSSYHMLTQEWCFNVSSLHVIQNLTLSLLSHNQGRCFYYERGGTAHDLFRAVAEKQKNGACCTRHQPVELRIDFIFLLHTYLVHDLKALFGPSCCSESWVFRAFTCTCTGVNNRCACQRFERKQHPEQQIPNAQHPSSQLNLGFPRGKG